MKIAICDDVIEEQNELQTFCQRLGYFDISLFSCGEDFLNAPDSSQFHLLFLDIEMKDMTGIEVKNILEKSSPFTLIIFITSHNEQIKDAFGRNVISFISKPFSEISIRHNIEKAAYLSHNFLPVKIDDNIAVPCEEILYLCSEQKYSIFHTKNGNSFSSRKSMKEWAKELEEFNFCPISRSIIINLKHYKKIQEKKVILHNGISFPISRRYTNLLKQKFDEYVLNMLRI